MLPDVGARITSGPPSPTIAYCPPAANTSGPRSPTLYIFPDVTGPPSCRPTVLFVLSHISCRMMPMSFCFFRLSFLEYFRSSSSFGVADPRPLADGSGGIAGGADGPQYFGFGLPVRKL